MLYPYILNSPGIYLDKTVKLPYIKLKPNAIRQTPKNTITALYTFILIKAFVLATKTETKPYHEISLNICPK